MMTKLALVIDIGTQSMRASLIKPDGMFKDMRQYKYPNEDFICNEIGQFEQHADYYYNILIKIVSDLLKSNSIVVSQILGLTITCFRDSAVMLDEDKKPIRPCILWLDQRLAAYKKKINPFKMLLFRLVGMKETIYLNRKKSMSIWYQENEIDNWNKCRHYVPLSVYLIYRLTGVLADAPSAYTGHYPINFKTGKWYSKHALKNIYGIPNYMLGKIVKSGSLIGKLTLQAISDFGISLPIEVYASGSDKSNETLGCGAIDNSTAVLSFGSAATVSVSSKKYIEPEKFLPAYPSVVPNYYNLEVQIYRGYWMLSWFLKECGQQEAMLALENGTVPEEYFNNVISSIPVGSDGLFVQPYWGPGLKRPLTRGAIIGFTGGHTKYHIYKAIIEGIGYALYEGLDSIQKQSHKKVKRLFITGGGSKSDVIAQSTADMFGLEVYRTVTNETTSVGGAISVFVATKYYSSYKEACKNMIIIDRKFEYNKENHDKYMKLYKKIYVKLFPRLKKVYADIKKESE